MYDRKTWIIVSICAILLALNVFFAPKRPQAPPAPATSSAPATAAGDAAQPGTPSSGGLAVVPPAPAPEKLVELQTGSSTFVLTTAGGGVKEARLKTEHEIGAPDKPLAINRAGLPVATLVDAAGSPLEVSYTVDEAASVPGKSVVMLGRAANGLMIRKTFSLVEGQQEGRDYLLNLAVTLENAGSAPLNLENYSLALGTAGPLYQRETPQWTSFFWRGGGEYTFKDVTYFKGRFGSAGKTLFETEVADAQFTGVANQFFATLINNKSSYQARFWARPAEVAVPAYAGGGTHPAVRAGVSLPAGALAAGGQRSIDFQIFMGPKENQKLRGMPGHLGDIMNYGFFSPVSNFLSWLLSVMHDLFDGVSQKWSWGFAVVALTIVIRTLIWPLHAKSTRTMKRMSKLQPEMKALKDKYPDDPTRMNQEMMKLYKKFGVNPLGGCLPMFLQIPIFFGFYRMLQYAVELRHQEFLWVKDLSQPDTMWALHLLGLHLPINVLPILMGITMVVQMRMTPQTGDAMQRRIMMLMPIIFLVFCYNFASALALYWTTQNLFSIGQTWLMNRLPEPELTARKPGKKSWMEKLAERQEQMKRAQEGRGASQPDATPAKKKRPPRTGG